MRPLETIIVEFLTWFWVLQAACGAWRARLAHRLAGRARRRPVRLSIDPPPPRAALVIPVKGVSDSFERFLDLVLDQDHPDYRILFVTESPRDPARRALCARLGLDEEEDRWTRPASREHGALSVRLVVAGRATDCGQKVHNQLAAFRLLQPGDAIVAFADADIIGQRDWLSRLCAPLENGSAEVTTGYRWIVPSSGDIVSIAITGINATVAALMGPAPLTRLWGGSMAMTRSLFDEIDIPGAIEGCFCEDAPMADAVRRAGKRIRFVRLLVMPTPVNCSRADLFEFARRQYFIVRTYWPGIWCLALLLVSLYLAGFAVSWFRLASGDWIAVAPLTLAFLANAARTVSRGRFIEDRFEPAIVAKLRPIHRAEWFTTTLTYLVHLAIILSSGITREIGWAGTRYRVRGRKSVIILEGSSHPD